MTMVENQTLVKPVQSDEDVHNSSESFVPSRVICVPIDGSKDSDYAVHWALDNLVNPDKDQIILLNVRPYNFSSSLAFGPAAAFADYSADLSADDANRAQSHTLLLQAAKAVKEKGVHVRAIAMKGDAREELVFKIEQLKPTFVVVGNRGLGQIARAILGSVSDYLVHHLHVPVLITRHP
ncbi:hypothetical protein EDD86DRAFT_199524 [Gorgonomyces haynaldii]|nr:hypothetical protein EDD86DRAFT_199524 [Gorgonomyces haynaldii]